MQKQKVFPVAGVARLQPHKKKPLNSCESSYQYNPMDVYVAAYQCLNQEVFESMVIWIGKDSESQSNEYLEECNTHQSGE